VRCSRVAGFSLIEALAALALTTTIVIALSTLAGQWMRDWSRGFANLQSADLLEAGLERAAQDISAARYVTLAAGDKTPFFEGAAGSVTFVRSAIGPGSPPRLEVVRIAEGRDDRGGALLRERAPFAPREPGGQARSFAFGDKVALVRAPLRVSFAYAGPDRNWVAAWRGQQSLPDAVRIEVRDQANRVLSASTAISMKVTAAPKLEMQASAAAHPNAAGAAASQSNSADADAQPSPGGAAAAGTGPQQ